MHVLTLNKKKSAKTKHIHTFITGYRILGCSLPSNPSDCVWIFGISIKSSVDQYKAFSKNCYKCLHFIESDVLPCVDVRVGFASLFSFTWLAYIFDSLTKWSYFIIHEEMKELPLRNAIRYLLGGQYFP